MTKTRDLSDFLIEGGADLPLGKPHIVPGVLYPAVSGNDINGTDIDTSHGSTYTYGELHTDGRKYYYTDIKGSKPIKDPRIGAHFGSQRHTTRSLQLLQQETATHGKEVFSVDGREWFRAVQSTGGNSWSATNGDYGNLIAISSDATGGFLEITGFFNDISFISTTANDIGLDMDVLVNGVSSVTDLSVGEASVLTPLGSRYVSAGSLINGGSTVSASLGTIPKINTLKLLVGSTGQQIRFHGIELIAQDTSSTANRSKIQIPAQNVVSFGKKFPISATAVHYDPFSAKTDGSAWTSPTSGNNTANSAASWPTNIDTANSLGLENWVNGSSYYRPYNGGRVVKYVDSTGTIKTAVTVMPPNARSIGNAANLSGGAEKGDDSAGNTSAAAPNDNYKPTFTDQTIATAEDLHEVAKTFHWREFGNGSANGGTGGTYPDASMYNSADAIAYVMDDGLTSLYGDLNVHNGGYGVSVDANSKFFYLTFIGTGISWNTGGAADNPHATWAQNLPYGTHILKFANDGSNVWDGNVLLDGVDIKNDFASGSNREMYKWSAKNDITIHQPKRPPIPEDACVIADYMLMADFVPQTSREVDKISKGVRRVNASRDLFYETNSGSIGFNQATAFAITEQFGFDVAIQNGTRFFQLPYFGTGNIVHFRGNSADRATDITYSINGNAVTDANFSGISRLSASSSGITFDADGTYGQNVGSQVHNFAGVKGGISLGLNTFKNQATEASKYLAVDGIDVHTPIHTSSHYQTFETPFLHELVGGDRNMEQTNLVCSPDGKTWDQLRRDTSYIGNRDCSFSRSNNTTMGSTANWIIDDVRGSANNDNLGNKNWCVAYDRIICLRDGVYTIHFMSATSSIHPHIFLNSTSGTAFKQPHAENADGNSSTSFFKEFKRGDFLVFQGGLSDASSLNAVARYIVLHITNNF